MMVTVRGAGRCMGCVRICLRMWVMASEIDMLADGSFGERTEGKDKFGREGPAIAKGEAMVADDVS